MIFQLTGGHFLGGWGTGMTMIEAKLVQQLAYLEQEPLCGTFLDLQKEYHDTMDRDRCLQILRGYEVGPNIL